MKNGFGGSIPSLKRPHLILICGDKDSYGSLRVLNRIIRDFPQSNIETTFIKKSDFKDIYEGPLDEILINFSKNLEDYELVVVIVLAGKEGEGHLGIGQLFDEGALCLLEAESDSESTVVAQTFLVSGKAHLEISLSEISTFLRLYFDFPEEVKTFFNPRNQIVWGALSAQFKEHGLDINTFKHSFIFEGILKRVRSKIEDPQAQTTEAFKKYISSLEEGPIELSRLYDSLEIHKSEFFKNPEAYEELRTKILPKVFEDNKERIQVWIPACGTGEETFSFTLVLYDFMQENNIQREFIINARDAHYEMIKSMTLKKGRYPLKSLEKIPKRYHQYLDIKKEEFVLKPEITSKFIFSTGNLITGGRLFGMDIVLCQNILPALKRSFQIEILQKMTVAVRAKGFLVTEGDTVLPEDVEENFKKTGEVDNCFFELVKRGDV
ncbi:MAG: CheR family methyltransferase, partial [Bdellovibrionota bacterium]|nr:CheR family methyltransferase [Bdellovibrionota bacterium]